MGREKSRMMEANERGWYEPNGYVCPDCVEDEFLKEFIRDNACSTECDYCGNITLDDSAASVEVLMEPIANAVFYYYNNPTDVYVSYDSGEGGWLLDSTDTNDVLESLALDCHHDLFEDIANSFVLNPETTSAITLCHAT